ncbi:MAG: Ig-like domain repeat protein [Nitrososphaerales archaeon]
MVGKQRASVLLSSAMILAIFLTAPVAYASTGHVFLTQFGSSGTGDGQFNQAWGVAVSSGHVFVSDLNERINEFTTTGTFLGWLGKCTGGSNCDTTTDTSIGFSCTAATCSGLTFGSGDGQFNGPRGLAVDAAGNLYVVDEGNQRIQVFTSTGTFVRAWGSSGSMDGQFAFPFGIAVSGSDVFVADTNNERVQEFTTAGTFVTTWNTAGGSGCSFDEPIGIAADSAGNVYVAQQANSCVDKFTSSGTFIGWAGACTSGSDCDTTTDTSDGFTCTATTCTGPIGGSGDGQFRGPSGVAADSKNDVFVVDESNLRVQEFSKTGAFSNVFGSGGCAGGQFGGPIEITVDSLGVVYVTDTNGSGCSTNSDRVEEFSLPTTSTSVSCSPSKVGTGSPTTCTATVTDSGSTTGTPTGQVKFKSSAAGTFSATKCTLSGSGKSASCSVTFTPTSTGHHKITATYQGNGSHAESQGTFTLKVT